ncbi:MAG: hypothetical protein ACM3VS_01265 [Candidatus Dadabacteria bacterium]
MKRTPIITSVESKLRFPGTGKDDTSQIDTLSYVESNEEHGQAVQFATSFTEIATTSCPVSLSGYVNIGFSSALDGRMYLLKIAVKTGFLATYIKSEGGILDITMAVSLS